MNFLEVGDEVTIQYNYCGCCDDLVGYDDYEMDEYDGVTLTIQPNNLVDSYNGGLLQPLPCGAARFEYDGWIWTTCWVTNHVSTFINREPNWEI
ncbi:MAG: hypothetical protein ACXACW_15670 [Candidatus Hodarchaeales archaeon]|jgi:hypothetical protein